MRKDFIFIFWAVLLLASVPAEARQDSFKGVSGALDGTTQAPDHPVPVGAEFVVTGNLWGLTSQVDRLEWGSLNVRGGCVVKSDLVDNQAKWASFTTVLEMTGANCSWSRLGSGIDVGIGGTETVLGKLSTSGNTPAFTMSDLGQEPSRSLSGYWAWTLLFGALIIFTLWHGEGWVWLLPAVAATIGFASSQLEAPAIAPVGALLFYMLGIWLVWWVSRKTERLVK